MKTYYGNYLGMVIDNNDPEFRGRVQVFVPHIMPTLYEGWNKKGENITINCVGDNMPQGLTAEIADRLKKILPWAEAASPIVGQSAAGGVTPANAPNNAPAGTQAAAGQMSGGQAVGADGTPVTSGPNSGSGAQQFNQSPTAVPQGSLPPGDSCKIPLAPGSDANLKMIKPKFAQRLNGFYQEATALGYKITCTSGWRSYEKQAALYAKIGSPGCAPPGGTSHELGIAVDLYTSGNGVSIQNISVAASRNGTNRDTPEYRALLAKYSLHQPLHPLTNASGPEHWHIEPIEMPKAKAGDRKTMAKIVSQQMGTADPPSGETTSSSQFPPASNPLTSKNPQSTGMTEPIAPKTGQTPIAPVQNASGGGVLGLDPVPVRTLPETAVDTSALTNTGGTLTPSSLPAAAGTTVTSGPTTGAAPTGGGNQLAKDRIAYFQQELTDPWVLDRLEYLCNREGGRSGRLILETACNRAYFNNTSLKKVISNQGYYGKGMGTKPHTGFVKDMIQKVIYNGANETDLATDQGYNVMYKGKLFIKMFQDDGVTGSWFDLNKGQKITDPGQVNSLNSKVGNGMQEFIYQKSGHGPNGSSKAGQEAKKYAQKYGITSSSGSSGPTYNPSVQPLPDNLKPTGSSDLTGEPLNASMMNSPNTVNNTDPHGPTVVKNTNDAAKGMFAFPGVGAMVWVFFREGNPQFPVYFAASYSSSEWKSAYGGSSLNPEGTNNGNAGSQLSNSMKLNPNAGGGLEFTHVKDTSDPSGAHDKAVAMIYGDDGSNMVFSKGFHQIYTRHDRRNQIDGNLYDILGGSEEKWIEGDSSINTRGNVLIKIGKIDNEALEAIKELSDFSKQLNDTLMSNSK